MKSVIATNIHKEKVKKYTFSTVFLYLSVDKKKIYYKVLLENVVHYFQYLVPLESHLLH